jgi:DNA-binding CsgD family transcriptional regulator
MLRDAADSGGVIREVGRDASSPAEFAGAVMDALSESVPFDGYCLFGTDPLSGVRSFMYSRHGLDGVAEQLTHNEFVEVDTNRYRDLSTADRPIGVMSAVDREGRRSPRMQGMLRPTGFGSELRLVLRSAGWVFGGLSLFRDTGARPFSDSDVERALDLAPGLRGAVQRHPVRPTSAPTTAMPTGVILVDASNRVLAATGAADGWLEELCIGGDDEMVPADHLRMVFDVSNAARSATGPAACRIRTATGRWLLVEAAPLDASPADIAITLRTADLASLLPAAAAWFGLTAREHEVLAALSRGLPAKHIARDLALAIPTVNAHLQSIYRKAAVTGREQLLASLG